MPKIPPCQNLAAAVLLCCTFGPSVHAADAEVDLSVPDAIQEALRSHVPIQRPPSPLASVVGQQTIDNKGNFGRLVEAKVEFSLMQLQNGLTGAQTSAVMDGGKAVGSGSSLSLCGLIGLLSESKSSTDTSTTTALPAGKVFLPFAIKSSVDFSRRGRLVGLETSASSLCEPASGVEFTLKTEEELIVKTSGLFGGTKEIKRVRESRCRTSADVKPASLIGEPLVGDYREVQCETVDGNGRTSKTRYAYLIASSFYLPIEEINDVQTTSIRYPIASYVKPE